MVRQAYQFTLSENGRLLSREVAQEPWKTHFNHVSEAIYPLPITQ
jgi:hypothetical protein